MDPQKDLFEGLHQLTKPTALKGLDQQSPIGLELLGCELKGKLA
jgi:hypothetical protein